MSSLNLTPEDINWFFPIFGVTTYGKILLLHRGSRMPRPKIKKRGNRKKITRISKRSLDRLLFRVSSSGISFTSLLTLTYGQNYPIDGINVKANLNHFIIKMKRSFGGFSYFWFLEFQKRGAPHIHIVTTIPPPDECRRELMATIWSEIAEDGNWYYTEVRPPYKRREAGFGMSTKDAVFRQHRRKEVWSAIRKKDGATRYALKYAAKQHQKIVPKNYQNVGRFWATSRDVSPPRGIEVPMQEHEVRALLHAIGRNFDTWKVLPKIIFLP